MKSETRNYSVDSVGALSQWGTHHFTHAAFPEPVAGKKFVMEGLGLSGMEVSFNSVPPRAAIPFYHRHRSNEELYIFLAGRGEMQIDGANVAVSEGSVVRVSPAGVRAWRNTGDGNLVFLVAQARAGTLAGGNISDGEAVPGEVQWS